jgi:hypothetical protein
LPSAVLAGLVDHLATLARAEAARTPLWLGSPVQRRQFLRRAITAGLARSTITLEAAVVQGLLGLLAVEQQGRSPAELAALGGRRQSLARQPSTHLEDRAAAAPAPREVQPQRPAAAGPGL